MSIFSTDIGTVSQGLVKIDTTGTSSGFQVVGSTSPEYIISTGANTYTSSQHVPQSPATGVVQRNIFPVTPLSSLPVGTQSTVYNSSSVISTATLEPMYDNSIFVFEWAVTIIPLSNDVILNVYAFTGPTPIGFSIVYYTTVGFAFIPTAGAVVGVYPFASTLTLNICAFQSSAGSANVSYAGSGDYCMLSEYNIIGAAITNTTVSSTSATPVTLFSVVGSFSTSLFIKGEVSYFDSAQLAGSAQTFQMLLQTPSSGSSTLAYNNIYGNSLALNPTLSFSIVTNTLKVSVIGIAGKTFECKASYTTTLV